MRNETKVVLSALEGREKYDDACKKTWMLREIIAPVLQYTIKEVLKTMCGLGESLENKGFEKGIEQGIEQGEKLKAIEIALNLLSGGMLNEEQIAAVTGLSADELKNLRPQKL